MVKVLSALQYAGFHSHEFFQNLLHFDTYEEMVEAMQKGRGGKRGRVVEEDGRKGWIGRGQKRDNHNKYRTQREEDLEGVIAG